MGAALSGRRVTFQSDWGQEFGGDNPQRVEELSQRFLAPWGGTLRRYPVGRKGYSGRVERRHRTDDEEFYRPYLLQTQDVPQFLELSALGVCRPHRGVGMENQPPLVVLQRLGYTGDARIALSRRCCWMRSAQTCFLPVTRRLVTIY